MKIRDILSEDGQVTLKPMPNAQQIVAPDGTVAGTAKDPNAAQQIKTLADKGELTLGGAGDQSNMQHEEIEEEGDESSDHFRNWMSSEYAPHDDDADDSKTVFTKALHFLNGKVHPHHAEKHAHRLAHKFYGGMGETHEDLVSQGNQDVGGDPTDRFINQVIDKKFEKTARQHGGNMSPLSENDNDLLNKMLSIAGLR
jgi:hypothetical protein